MGALYAMRGVGVVVFVNGGLSFIGITLFALGIVFAAPVVLGFAVLLGIADTWLDLRARVGSQAT
jgi:Sec-independent protein secretion pathway component TatC